MADDKKGGELLSFDFGGGDAKKGPPRKFVPRPAPPKRVKGEGGDAAAAAPAPARKPVARKPAPAATSPTKSDLPDPPTDDGPPPPKASYAFNPDDANPFGSKKPKMALDGPVVVASEPPSDSSAAAAAEPAPAPAAAAAAEPPKPVERKAPVRAAAAKKPAPTPAPAQNSDAPASADDGPIPPKAAYAFNPEDANPFGSKKPKMALDGPVVVAADAGAAEAPTEAKNGTPALHSSPPSSSPFSLSPVALPPQNQMSLRLRPNRLCANRR
jgi:nicotinate-nucleotide--dimethylbenzimidazole phosphoribosyltransferase